MIIQLPEWNDWRVEGSDNDWQIQTLIHRGRGDSWDATNYFPSLGYAVAHAYEKALRASKKRAETTEQVLAECGRIKEALVDAVEKALKEAAS